MPQDIEAHKSDERRSRLRRDQEDSMAEATHPQEEQNDSEPVVAFLKAYQPSGRVTFIGILLMPLLGSAGAYLGAYLYALFVEHLCTLIVIFPLVAGGIAGAGVSLGAYWGKIRNGGLAVLIGLAVGLFAFGLHYSWGYRNMHEVIRSYILETDGVRLTDAEVHELADEILMEDTRHTGVYGYALFASANSQLSFFRVGATTFDSYELDSTPDWLGRLVAIVNLLAAGVGGLIVGGGQAVSPFCEEDKRWYRHEIIFRSSLDSAKYLTVLVLGGGYAAIPEFLEPPSPQGAFALEIRYCPACRNGYLEASLNAGKERKLICRLAISAPQVAELLALQKDAPAVLKARGEAQASDIQTKEKA